MAVSGALIAVLLVGAFFISRILLPKPKSPPTFGADAGTWEGSTVYNKFLAACWPSTTKVYVLRSPGGVPVENLASHWFNP